MCSNTITKTELPVAATPEIMELLIKAKHFFAHATLHAQSENSFDSMIAIHSLDNSIEYMLRIIIKHLEIETKLSKTINTPELMGLFSEVNIFLRDYTLLNGKGTGLPYEVEIRQLRVLRNNVQHGMILPVNELKNLLKYGDRFFEKVLQKIFGLSLQQISYSTLVENDSIKNLLTTAEQCIEQKHYLEAVVACRDAFELGQFLLQDHGHHVNKMAALPYIKQDSMELYDYIQSIDEEVSILASNINMADYRLFARYVDHIPSQYRAVKAGYSLMQREWEKRDADFCYAFVAQTILNWQLKQVRPLYEIDMSHNPPFSRELTINGVRLPEIHPEKTCFYMLEDNREAQLLLINGENKKMLQKLRVGDVCEFHLKYWREGLEESIREYTEYVIIDAVEFNLVLNKGSLWEIMLSYRNIPFSCITDMGMEIDLDGIDALTPENAEDEQTIELIRNFGAIDSIEKAFELKKQLIEKEIDSKIHTASKSSNLIALLKAKVPNVN